MWQTIEFYYTILLNMHSGGWRHHGFSKSNKSRKQNLKLKKKKNRREERNKMIINFLSLVPQPTYMTNKP